MKNYLLGIGVFMLALVACKAPADEKSILSEIEDLESLIYGDGQTESVETEDLEKLSGLYDSYAQNYAGDEAPEYYFKAAEVEKSLGNFEQAIEHFDAIIDNYPEHDKTPMSLFYKGFIYENDLLDLNSANQCYHQFADLYPDHALIESVQFSINNLGRPIEEIIFEFDKENAKENNKKAGNTKTIIYEDR